MSLPDGKHWIENCGRGLDENSKQLVISGGRWGGHSLKKTIAPMRESTVKGSKTKQGSDRGRGLSGEM